MSLIAKNEGNVNITKLEDGVYTAVSSMLIDLGMQKSTIDGKVRKRLIMVWNIVGETIEINGEQLPRILTKEYALSLNEKSNLRKDLQAWRGKTFTEEELQGFDLKNVLNKGCLLQIINEEKNNKTYTNIVSIMALQKGVAVQQLDKIIEFYIDEKETWANLQYIPKWIIEKIKKSEGYEGTELSQYIGKMEQTNAENSTSNASANAGVVSSDDDLPF